MHKSLEKLEHRLVINEYYVLVHKNCIQYVKEFILKKQKFLQQL